MERMMFSILLVIFISISQARTDSLLTGTYDPNSTSLINDRRDIREIDVLRQIINQETLIRLAVVKDVKAIVDDVSSVKRSMASSETMVYTLQQTVERLQKQIDSLSQNNTLQQNLERLQRQVDSLSQDNSLQRKVEALQRQVDNLSKNNTLVQTVETLESQVNSLRKDNALQQKVDSTKRRVDSLSKENERITVNQNKIQEFDQMFKIFKENITDIHEDVQIVKKVLKVHTDCKDIYQNRYTQSGVYPINPFGNENQVNVYCDMETEGGGWTAIQKRRGGSVTFNKTWAEYKRGFGNPSDTYWIGNDVIHQLTKGNNSSFYVSITLRNGSSFHELYHQFSVSDESDKYRLFLGGPAIGTLGDRMLSTNTYGADLSGMYFSTPDRDNDRNSKYNCAVVYGGGGGWWYNSCHQAYLNGPWSPGYWFHPWSPLVKDGSEVMETLMMIKPH
ncbi:fibrinogen-like protein 1 [Saccostrea echinata]|uniref:fibrinogen-like protein 1 n=1 Tax=Saccostrea echinata TaxID=191078 RepID=UPI002A80289F|nr:fibrinogen-like protein 1 [Saccostrea echinata]